MKNKTPSRDIVNADGYLSCGNNLFDLSYGFNYVELAGGGGDGIARSSSKNVILFILSGTCTISYDQYAPREFNSFEMIFFPKSSLITFRATDNMKLVYFTFEEMSTAGSRKTIERLGAFKSKVEYEFKSLYMKGVIRDYILQLSSYLKSGIDCAQLLDIKQTEFFILLRYFYSGEEQAMFFYPVVGYDLTFRNFVLDNYQKCYNADELIRRSHITKNTFVIKFKKEFGMTVYQWMLKQMCQKILLKVIEPNITIRDLMDEISISDNTHFNRICRRHFDKTPKELIFFYTIEK